MARTRLSKCPYVEYGYGQVEPNHLSAQRTGQIYAQLPANKEIDVLENGQFVKYDYANKEVNFTGAGEWMLVFNEVKVYRDHQYEADFAMVSENYVARVYSPIDGENISIAKSRNYDNDIAPADPYEVDSTDSPFDVVRYHNPAFMKGYTESNEFPYDATMGARMVPRVFKTNIGDLYTTNTIKTATAATILAIDDRLQVGADGYLAVADEPVDGEMTWQVVKVYNLPDRQKAVKIMRIQ